MITQPHLIATQPHGTQALAPHLLNMLNRLQEMRHKLLRILGGREMAQAGHGLVLRALDLVGRLLRHLGRVAPVVLAREHEHGARVGVDGRYSRSPVPAAEIEV